MIAQMQCIFYSKFLAPLKKLVLDQLQALVMGGRREHWLTIYLVLFILLHSCSMITRRNEEFAKSLGLPVRFMNPGAIRDQHDGANILLAHFHYINRGDYPFRQALKGWGLKDIKDEAALTDEQAQFVRETALLVEERESRMKTVYDGRQFGDDYYWIYQLYLKDWSPSPTA